MIDFKTIIITQMCYNKNDRTFNIYKQDSKIRLYYNKEEITFYIYDLINNGIIEQINELNDIVTYKVNF